MYVKFTQRAREVINLANDEAKKFNHNYICTEHILIGLIREGYGAAAIFLKELEVDLRKAREELEKLNPSLPDIVQLGRLPQTPKAKRIIDYAMQETRKLNHKSVGTEHILLAILRKPQNPDERNIAYQMLENIIGGENIEETRKTLEGRFLPYRKS